MCVHVESNMNLVWTIWLLTSQIEEVEEDFEKKQW